MCPGLILFSSFSVTLTTNMTNLVDLYSSAYNLAHFQEVDVCRLCWKAGANVEMKYPPSTVNFSAKRRESNKNIASKLIPMISYCLNIEVEILDHYPKRVCESCIKNIQNFCYYKEFCSEANKRLHEILININVKCENNADSDGVQSSNCSFDIPLLQLRQQKGQTLEDTETPFLETNHALKRQTDTCCNICIQDCSTQLGEHECSAHGVDNSGYYCFGCRKLCPSKQTRLAHEKNCDRLKDGYRCATCGETFATRRSHNQHAVRSHRPAQHWSCVQCNKAFKTRANLAGHTAAVHADIKKHVCEFCGRGFNRRDYLVKHMRTHTGQKPYKCTHCDYRTTQKNSLTVHIRKHTGEKPFECDICHRRCLSSANLLTHRRRHAGLKNFQCALCGKRYGYKLSLAEHMAVSHDQLRGHVCALCGATYTRRRGLRAHALAKHGAKTGEEQKSSINGHGISSTSDAQEFP